MEGTETRKAVLFFVPQDIDLQNEYEQEWLITDAMPQNLLGFQTHRDPIAIAFDERTLRKQVSDYLKHQPSLQDWERWNQPCLYRPFDLRRVYLHKDVTDRARLEVTRHLFEIILHSIWYGKQKQKLGNMHL